MSLRGKTAIVGIGQTPYFKRGQAGEPEQKLALRAIVAACEDAGIDPRDIEGFVSYGSERNTGQQMLPALGLRDLKFAALAWTHGGGIPGALALAAMVIVTGQAEVVVVHRAMAEASHQRVSVAVTQDETPAQFLVNGVDFVLLRSAMRGMRLMHEGVPPSVFEAIARAGYHHAQNNPHASAYGQPLTPAAYAKSRWIAEPLHLHDCSRENDAAAAVVMVSAERARDLKQKAAYLLSAPMGAGATQGSREDNHEPYTSVGMIGLAERLWRESGYGPADVDVAQVYENFTPMAAMALIDHGFCTRESAGEVLTFENLIAPSGNLPINTSGGNIADGFIHGMGLVPEAVRQIRGTSPNQVPDAHLSLITGGPGDSLTSTALLGSAEAL